LLLLALPLLLLPLVLLLLLLLQLLQLFLLRSYPLLCGCEACALHRHHLFPGVYQCMGCCFSRAFPTPPATLRTMVRPKPITSQASCCVASSYEEVRVELTVKNHTSCHCGTCKYHKISSG
uniref:Glycoprotein hormones alpha chain n=1 Tax=Periophthalmus magnuspinnatus TaxID=409849 RepID=A0A3B3Z9J6_9GOBI